MRKAFAILMGLALLPSVSSARSEFFQDGINALKESDVDRALVAFEASDTKASFYAASTIYCLAFEQHDRCGKSARLILKSAQQGVIDDLVLVASGASSSSPFGFTAAESQSAQVELLKRGVGDQDREAGWSMLNNGDHEGLSLLLNAAKRKDPSAQFLMAQHEATHHEDLIKSLLWLDVAYQNGFFVRGGLDPADAEQVYRVRYDAIYDAMKASEQKAFDAKLGAFREEFVGPEQVVAPSHDLLVVTQVADILSSPDEANLFTSEMAKEKELAAVTLPEDIALHEAKLKSWLTENQVALPQGCTLGISTMDSGAIADIGFAPNCELDYTKESDIRNTIWDLPAPPSFVSGGSMPAYFNLQY